MKIINFLKRNIYKDKIKTLFLVDILYMKDINSVYGFKNGDYIIHQLKQLIEDKIKKELRVYFKPNILIEYNKLYVDVFGIKIYDDLTEKQMQHVQTIIFNSIITHKFYLFNNKSIDIDITIGCSKSDNENLRIYAEKALHSAKMNYSNFMYLDSKLFDNEVENINFISIINNNIDKRLVEPYFQPIVDAQTHEVHKYEALMRIFDDDGNIISPAVFLGRSKKYRLYTKLMSILIDKVMSYILKYKLHVSINLDFNDILNPHVKRDIISHLEKYDIGEYLTIEILESQKISNYEVVNEFISELKRYKVKIAIDDFGSGFSNYEHILNLNIDYIKIDGSLIQKIHERMYSNLISSIVTFCKQQNIKVVAEFVSDLKIARYVRALGIDFSQGYYIGKPVSITKIVGELHER
jgi:EAL domain-containing protein (putative c-di-GMP-specific phosphodiesterase class I)/GGDEF domain-containing protein